MALGWHNVPNIDECVGSPPQPPTNSEGCSSGALTQAAAVLTTSDGGATWQLRQLPSDVPLPQMYDVSCSGATSCWLSGEEAVPEHIGNSYDGRSAVLLGTSDGGTTWTKATFVVPQGAPNDVGGDAYLAVGQISCPGVDDCMALGVVDQGSKSTPFYGNVADSNS
jgi:hypothetical protein